MTDCKHCGKPIKFVNIGGKWKPTDQATGELHRCELDQRCESCGVTFKGPPWMKECSLCYRGELRKGRAWSRDETAPGGARKPERLGEVSDDDDTPF